MFHWEQAQLSPMCAQHAPLSTTFMTIQLTFTITTVSFRTMLSLRIQLFTQQPAVASAFPHTAFAACCHFR